MPFLWVRRRRLQDPGDPATGPAIATLLLTTEMNKRSHSLNSLSDSHHLVDIKIPDHRLGIITPEETAPMASNWSEEMAVTCYPPSTPGEELSEILEGGRTTSKPLILSESAQEGRKRSTSEATVISSRLNSKGLTRRPSSPRKSVPNPLDIGRTKVIDSHHRSNPDRQQRNLDSEEDLSGETLVSTTEGHFQRSKSKSKVIEADMATGGTTKHKMAHLEFASIPITITTGCDHNLSCRLIEQNQHDQLNGLAEDRSHIPATLNTQRAQERRCTDSIATQDRNATASHHSTTPNGWQSSEHHLKTPKPDSASSQEAVPRRSYLRDCSPKTRRGCAHRNRDKKHTDPEHRMSAPAEAPNTSRRQSPIKKQQDFALQAATMTMLRSQITAGSSPSNTVQPRSRSPSPMRPQYKCFWPAIGHPSWKEQRQQPMTTVSVGTGDPSKASKSSWESNFDAVTILYDICIAMINTILVVGFAWWNFVQPAFNERSGLRRRRQRKMSTLGDLGVFSSAGLFCFIGGAIIWYSMKITKWLVF